MGGTISIKFLFLFSLVYTTMGMHGFNEHVNKYSSSLYTNIGDPLFQKYYIKEYNFYTESNLLFETTEMRIQSLNQIISLFCESKILNFLTKTLMDKKIINEKFEKIVQKEKPLEKEELKKEIVEKIEEDGGRKIDDENYLDKKRKKIKIKGKIYEIPDSWAKRGIETWNDFQNHVMEMLSGEYKTVNEDFRSNLSKVINGLGSIDLDKISMDLAEQYGFLEASYIKYYINMDFSDDEEENSKTK